MRKQGETDWKWLLAMAAFGTFAPFAPLMLALPMIFFGDELAILLGVQSWPWVFKILFFPIAYGICIGACGVTCFWLYEAYKEFNRNR